MKKSIVLSIIFLGMLCHALGQRITAATFNLRYDNPDDAGNLWKDRVAPIAAAIRFHHFDVFGTQEALWHQLQSLSEKLPEYARYGKGRNDGKQAGEHAAIYYKSDLYQLLDSGDFWLSETPDIPGLGWDATCCNRICSWVFLKEKKSGKKFYVFNVHFDHEGKKARAESAKLMITKIAAIARQAPVIFMGDFNSGRDSEPYKILSAATAIKDSYLDVKYPYEPNGSFNGFGKTINSKEIIDHIFINAHSRALQWGVLTDTYHGKYLSDHFPVMAVIDLKK